MKKLNFTILIFGLCAFWGCFNEKEPDLSAPVKYFTVKNSTPYTISSVKFSDGLQVGGINGHDRDILSGNTATLGIGNLGRIDPYEYGNIDYSDWSSFEYRYLVLEFHDINCLVTADLKFSFDYLLAKSQWGDTLIELEVTPDLQVKNINTGDIYETRQKFYFANTGFNLKSKIDSHLASVKNYENNLVSAIWEKLGEFSQEGKITVSRDGKTISSFTTIEDVVAYFGLDLNDGYYGDIFSYVKISMHDSYSEEVYSAINEVEDAYVNSTSKPALLGSILSSEFSEIATEDDNFIYIEGEAPIDKNNYDNKAELYYYAGVIPNYTGAKGIVQKGVKLWGVDPDDSSKRSMPYYIPKYKKSPDDFFEIGLKAAMQEITNATNGAINFREVSSILERTYSGRYVTAGYYHSNFDSVAQATLGAKHCSVLEVNLTFLDKYFGGRSSVLSYFIIARDNGLLDTIDIGGRKTLRLYNTDSAELAKIFGSEYNVDEIYFYLGALQHELLHNLGISHEHQRYDRANYIWINGNDPSNYNNRLITYENSQFLHPTYDYLSIMSYSFSSNCIVNDFFGSIQDTFVLSEIDKEFLAHIYGGKYRSPLDKLFALKIVALDRSTTYPSNTLGITTNNKKYKLDEFNYLGINFSKTLADTFVNLPYLIVPNGTTNIDLVIQKFYGQQVFLEYGTKKYEVTLPNQRIFLDEATTNVNLTVTSQDRNHTTNYVLPIYRPTSKLHSIALYNGNNNVLLLEKSLSQDSSDIYYGGVKSDVVNVKIVGEYGQKLTIDEKTYLLENSNEVVVPVNMSGLFTKTIDVQVNFLIDGEVYHLNGTELCSNYKITLAREYADAIPDYIKASYKDVKKNGSIDTVDGLNIRNYTSDIYIGSKDNCSLNFSVGLKDLSSIGKTQKLYYFTQSDGKTSNKIEVKTPNDFTITVPTNEFYTINLIVKVDEYQENIYSVRFYAYNFIKLNFNIENGVKAKLYGSNKIENFTNANLLSKNSSITIATIPGIGLKATCAFGYHIDFNQPFVKAVSGNRYEFDFNKLNLSEADINIFASVSSGSARPSLAGGWSNKNQGSLEFLFNDSYFISQVEGKFLVSLKTPSASVDYRIKKEEVRGGCIMLLDVFENHRDYENPSRPRLGRSYINNGIYPETGWYNFRASKDSFILGRLKLDVSNKVAVDLEVVFDYQMPTLD